MLPTASLKPDASLLPARVGLPERFGLSPGCRATGHGWLCLRFGLLLGYRAAGDGYDVVLYGGDLAPHGRPDPDGEALVHGLSYLLFVLDLVPLGDERRGRLQPPAAEGQVHARDAADERDDAFFGALRLYGGVLLALPSPLDQEQRIGHPAHVGVALSQDFYGHIVQVWPAV